MVNAELSTPWKPTEFHMYGMEDAALFMFADTIDARIVSTWPRPDDLVDKYLSQWSPDLVNKLKYLKTHPQAMEQFWRECFEKIGQEERQELLKDISVFVQALKYVSALFDNLIVLAEDCDRASDLDKLMEDPNCMIYGNPRLIRLANDLVDNFLEIADATICSKYFVSIESFPKAYKRNKIGGFVGDDSKGHVACEDENRLAALPGLVVAYLFGPTSIKGLLHVLQNVQEQANGTY